MADLTALDDRVGPSARYQARAREVAANLVYAATLGTVGHASSLYDELLEEDPMLARCVAHELLSSARSLLLHLSVAAGCHVDDIHEELPTWVAVDAAFTTQHQHDDRPDGGTTP